MKKLVSLGLLAGTVALSAAEFLPLKLNDEWTLHMSDTPFDAKVVASDTVLPGGTKIRMTGNACVLPSENLQDAHYALLQNEFEAEREGFMQMGCGADWFFEVRINGAVVLDRMEKGNADDPIGIHNFPVDLPVRKGRNLLTVTVRNGTGGWRFCAGAIPFLDLSKRIPSGENFRRLTEKPAPEGTSDRKLQEELLQAAINTMTNPVFYSFYSRPDIPENELREIYKKYPLLEFYDTALDRVLDGLKTEKVPEGGAVMWHLYNMGFVVKTSDVCFGIDLHHRRAHLLEPYLDFLLVTHNHGDHQSMLLFRKMIDKKKIIVNNFFSCKGYSRPPETFRFGSVTVHTAETDHNDWLRKFMTTYRIVCGDKKDSPVIYHTGDTGFYEQLHPGGPVDYFIVHPRVGLNVPKAVEAFHPACVVFGHMMEMGHCPPSPYYPVPYHCAHDDIKKIRKNESAAGGTARPCQFHVPFWGEKIVLKQGGEQK